ncbi:DUF2867 domain-containing protein [Oryzomicrobium sp.]|uniref:DUF2867 domain-containing protein n=1 Tax=Oryzomicrobium sp. TaxID=1911578 RepID=UPI002FE137AC
MPELTDRIPLASRLHGEQAAYSYRDSFTLPVRRGDLDAEGLMALFFATVPPWLSRLTALRNVLVRPFGLKTGTGPMLPIAPPFTVGQRIGLFRLLALDGREAVLGDDDRHLNFRISLLLDDNGGDGGTPALSASTLVRPHNRLGRIYLALVLPIHRLAVPAVTRRMAMLIDRAP